MTGKLSFVTEAAWSLLQRLEGGDSVAVYAFNHGLMVGPHGAAGDLGRVEPFIRELAPAGGTALYDALSEVLRDLPPGRGRKAIIVFSDGQDEQSLLTLQQVVSNARQSEAIVYTVGAGSSERDVEAREDLETLARETGGQALFFDSYKKLDVGVRVGAGRPALAVRAQLHAARGRERRARDRGQGRKDPAIGFAAGRATCTISVSLSAQPPPDFDLRPHHRRALRRPAPPCRPRRRAAPSSTTPAGWRRRTCPSPEPSASGDSVTVKLT